MTAGTHTVAATNAHILVDPNMLSAGVIAELHRAGRNAGMTVDALFRVNINDFAN
jgi:hypothetical protein